MAKKGLGKGLDALFAEAPQKYVEFYTLICYTKENLFCYGLGGLHEIQRAHFAPRVQISCDGGTV